MRPPHVSATLFGVPFILIAVLFSLYGLGYSFDYSALGLIIPVILIVLGALGLVLTKK